jgi:hypothetical protein
MKVAIIGAGNVGEAMLRLQLALKHHDRVSPAWWRAAMPQTGRPSRALGWSIPILKNWSSYGHPR